MEKKGINMDTTVVPEAQPPPVPHNPPVLPPTPTKMLHDQQPKKFMPLTAFCFAFFICLTLLLIYMDNNAVRHHQFRLNMSQDYELLGIAQDNEELIIYIREVLLTPAIEPSHPPLESDMDGPSDDVEYALSLLKNKRGGIFIEAGAYHDGKTSETEWLEKNMSWHGLLVQPDPRHFFKLKRYNRTRSLALHACLSPTSYPKEITYHNEERDDVKIDSLHNNFIEDPDWFNTRVKCFSLYSLMLAMNTTKIDYFSLESGGTELQVLETIPFEKVRIDIIDVHLLTNETEHTTIKKFLATKNYTFKQNFNTSYIFHRN